MNNILPLAKLTMSQNDPPQRPHVDDLLPCLLQGMTLIVPRPFHQILKSDLSLHLVLGYSKDVD